MRNMRKFVSRVHSVVVINDDEEFEREWTVMNHYQANALNSIKSVN